MKKAWILLLFICLITTACNNQDKETTISQAQISGLAQESSTLSDTSPLQEDVVINSLLESRYLGQGMEVVPIPDIKDYSEINAAWIDEKTLLFGAYNEPKLDDPSLYSNKEAVERLEKEADWSKYPISFYRSDLTTGDFTKVFEYPLSGRMPFLYLNVLDNGDFAFKTSKELVVISGENYTVRMKYDIPTYAGIVNVAISPNGKNIAVVDNEKHACKIISTKDYSEVYSYKLDSSLVYMAPQWEDDSQRLFCYSTQYEFLDSVAILNLNDKSTLTYDYSADIKSMNSRVYWSGDPSVMQRFDEQESEESVTNILELYSIKDKSRKVKTYPLSNALNSVSVSKYGSVIGNQFDGAFSTKIINTLTNTIFSTERAADGGSMIPAVWSQDGQRVIAFYTAITNEKGEYSRWTAILYDTVQLFKK
ncbi:hypothetical protein [Acetanaerobacterium elongatum]|uniref:WD40-like Beta Propeller Repeat n=1 Tax=Acetanaerobacterium elongatum TaxID=258515 RepID=A0A1G9U7N3_9FIRM|nr:hypothetical protein [Acetanaerobacterium elongatum]SDM56016.1 hypothetical protein SAMN05192585_101108 [Acetanaerobacterium elongatum]